MPKIIGNVELYLGPQETGGPDDLLQTIIGFIDGAQHYLDIAVQELDQFDIGQAIVRAKLRGVRVKIVLEADYLTNARTATAPFVPGGDREINRTIHDALLRSRSYVRSDFNPDIFHQKFIIRDNSSLLTGSTNFTTTGTSTNLNHLVIVHDEEIARIYKREFKEICQGHFGKLNEGHDKAPKDAVISGVPIRVLFAPDHNPEMEIMKQMAKARQRIDFAIFTFSNSSGIDDQMIARRQAGLIVRGVLDAGQGNHEWAASHALAENDIDIRLVPEKAPVRKLHHKLMVLDQQVIIAGSFNYTGNANMLNDENIIILGDLDETDPVSIAKQQQLGDYAYTEIDRIYQTFGIPFV